MTCRIERGANSFCKYKHAIVFANTSMRMYLHGNLKENSIRMRQRVARGRSCDGQWGGIGQYVFVFVFASQDKTQKKQKYKYTEGEARAKSGWRRRQWWPLGRRWPPARAPKWYAAELYYVLGLLVYQTKVVCSRTLLCTGLYFTMYLVLCTRPVRIPNRTKHYYIVVSLY